MINWKLLSFVDSEVTERRGGPLSLIWFIENKILNIRHSANTLRVNGQTESSRTHCPGSVRSLLDDRDIASIAFSRSNNWAETDN